MGINERRENEKEVLKKKIIDAATEILVKEGYENLSIRKIANKIEYSPGIIYHYFKDKAEIVSFVVEEGYGRMLRELSEVLIDEENPEKSIEEGLRRYIDIRLEQPELFRTIMMNDIEAIQEKVNMLYKGISKERKSIQILCKQIEIGIKNGKFKDMDVELTAQIIWTSTHGLLSRLILEKNISKEQKDRLIRHNFQMLFNGLLK